MNTKSRGEKIVDELEKYEVENLAPFALKSSERRIELEEKFRKYKPDTQLEYRTEYQRDRDRIIWSKTFKRLQHKTQIFPCYSTDHFRRRLTHSLEVSQVATTIARALKLNVDAAEAMALAHDLGHTPFGHAGEKALNEECLPKLKTELEKLNKELKEGNEVPVCIFNHALQGIEVVERIETEYASDYYGLNLTFDVREGILKHMRFEKDNEQKGSDPILLDEVVKFGQYRQFENNFGSLEAQCVLVADKIAYFFHDFEDALRAHILECKIFEDKEFTEFKRLLTESVIDSRKIEFENIENLDGFLLFRRKALAAFILNIAENSEESLKNFGIKSVKDGKKDRFISLSKDIDIKKEQLYKKYIKEKVFSHEKYQATEFKAKKIVNELFKAYHDNKELIPKDFQDHTSNAYKGLVADEEQEKAVLVRNYISGMTDSFVIAKHKDLFMSSEQILIS